MVEENGLLEVLERLVIEVELALESAIRDPAAPAKQVQDLVEHLVEVHVPNPYHSGEYGAHLSVRCGKPGVPGVRLHQPGLVAPRPAAARMMPQTAARCRVLPG